MIRSGVLKDAYYDAAKAAIVFVVDVEGREYAFPATEDMYRCDDGRDKRKGMEELARLYCATKKGTVVKIDDQR